MILASQFNSFLHPVTVLTICPVVAGAVRALWHRQDPEHLLDDRPAALMGIVKKNSIILVDYANQPRARVDAAGQAMLRAGPVRLRPILMTSMATMMAAYPGGARLGPGSETRRRWRWR
jgi:multidrug efflux pump